MYWNNLFSYFFTMRYNTFFLHTIRFCFLLSYKEVRQGRINYYTWGINLLNTLCFLFLITCISQRKKENKANVWILQATYQNQSSQWLFLKLLSHESQWVTVTWFSAIKYSKCMLEYFVDSLYKSEFETFSNSAVFLLLQKYNLLCYNISKFDLFVKQLKLRLFICLCSEIMNAIFNFKYLTFDLKFKML